MNFSAPVRDLWELRKCSLCHCLVTFCHLDFVSIDFDFILILSHIAIYIMCTESHWMPSNINTRTINLHYIYKEPVPSKCKWI